ncbi:MAG: DUF4197 domain-containing protein [Novosphingobium sp.]
MVTPDLNTVARRTFLAGTAATAVLALPGCNSLPALNLTEAIRRLLTRSSRAAFARLTAPGGFYDHELARLNLPDVFGRRGGVLQNILTSAAFKSRLQREFNHIAERGARRAAPLVADAVRLIGIDNARELIRGGPTAATAFLRQSMGASLIEAMVPELGEGLRLASDPIVGEVIAALTGVDVGNIARSLSVLADEAIWSEIGRQEAEIRARPESTNDPVLIGALKAL